VLFQISGTNPVSTQTFSVKLDPTIQVTTFQFVIYKELDEQVFNHNISISNVVSIVENGYDTTYIVDLPIPGELCSNNMYVIVSVITDQIGTTFITPFSDPVLIVGPPLTPTISYAFRTTDGSHNLDIYLDPSFVCSLDNKMNIAVQYTDLNEQVHFDIYSNLDISLSTYEGIEYYYCTVIADGGSLPLPDQGHISAQQVTLFGGGSIIYSSSSKFGNTVEVDTAPLPPVNVDASYNCDILTTITWDSNTFNDQYFYTTGYNIYVYSSGYSDVSEVEIIYVESSEPNISYSYVYDQSNNELIATGDQITFTVTTLATHKDDQYKHEESLQSDPTAAYMYIQPANAPTNFEGAIAVNLLSINLTWDTPTDDGCGGNAEISYYILSCDVSLGSPFDSVDLSYTDTSYVATGLESGAIYTFTLTPWTGSELCVAQAGADVSSNPFPMTISPSGPVTDLQAVPGDVSYNTDFAYALSGYIEWRNPVDIGNLTPAYFIIDIPGTDVSNSQVTPYVDDPAHIYSVNVPNDAYTDLVPNTDYTATVWLVTEDDMSGNVTDGSTNTVDFTTNVIVAEPVVATGEVNLNTLIADISWNWDVSDNGNLAPSYFNVSWVNADGSLNSADGSFNQLYVGQGPYTVAIPETGYLVENSVYNVSIYLVTEDENGYKSYNEATLPNLTLDTTRTGADAPSVSAVGGYEYVNVGWSEPSYNDYTDPSFYILTVTDGASFDISYEIAFASGQRYFDVSGLSNETLYTFTVSLTVSTNAGDIPGAPGTTQAMPTGYPVFFFAPVIDSSGTTVSGDVWSNSSGGNMGDNAIVIMKFSDGTSKVATFGPGPNTIQFPETTWTAISESGTPGSIYEITGNSTTEDIGIGTVIITKSTASQPIDIAPGSKLYNIIITPTLSGTETLQSAVISVSNTSGATSRPTIGFNIVVVD
jgi:hypothetical protein